MTAKQKTIKVTLKRSLIGRTPKQKANAIGLGLRHTNHTVEVIDTPENWGMINKIKPFLVVGE